MPRLIDVDHRKSLQQVSEEQRAGEAGGEQARNPRQKGGEQARGEGEEEGVRQLDGVQLRPGPERAPGCVDDHARQATD